MLASDDKRQQIVNAAQSYFGKYGYSKTTLEDIAGFLGMKKNSLYYYFPSKEALFQEVVRENISRLYSKIKEVISSKKTASEKLIAVLEYSEKLKQEDNNWENLTIQAVVDLHNAFIDIYAEYHQHGVVLIQRIINDGIKTGEFKKCNAHEVASAIIEMVNSIRMKKFYSSRAKFINEIDFSAAHKSINTLAELIVDGLKSK